MREVTDAGSAIDSVPRGRTVVISDIRVSSEFDADEPHPWYGPCDGFGPYGECSVCTTRDREFEVGFNFIGWAQWSLGVHFDPQHPHVDIHVPSGFLRIGWYSIKVSDHRLQQGRRPKWTRLIGGNPFRDDRHCPRRTKGTR